MFHPIDFAAWDRAEYYQHYMNNARCTYSITANVDITVLYHAAKARPLRLTPCLTWLSAHAVNSIVNLRFDRNSEGQVGWYDTTSPAYTVWNPETKLFSSLYTPYSESFREFYEAMCRDIALWGKKGGVQPQGNFPPNVHNFSSIPWLHYTEINLNLYTDGDFLPPIITVGQAAEQNGRLMLPVTLQIHHSVADGWHASEYFRILQETAATAEEWIDR